MSNSPIVKSIFDRESKLECPTASFGWRPPEKTYVYSKSEVLCDGVLQEMDAMTSSLRSSKFYAATSREILKFSVLFLAPHFN